MWQWDMDGFIGWCDLCINMKLVCEVSKYDKYEVSKCEVDTQFILFCKFG